MTDITANVVVSMPSQLFTMARSFKAVANGKIYIGKIDTDPVNPENQIQVYVENEDGSHVPVSQPIIINAAGYPVYNGQIAKFVTVQGHSMAVYDAYGTQQFYFPNVLKYDPDQLEQRLSSNDGASLIGTASGDSVQDVINVIEKTLNTLPGRFSVVYSEPINDPDHAQSLNQTENYIFIGYDNDGAGHVKRIKKSDFSSIDSGVITSSHLQGICVVDDDTIYVGGNNDGELVKYSFATGLKTTVATAGLRRDYPLCYDGNYIYQLQNRDESLSTGAFEYISKIIIGDGVIARTTLDRENVKFGYMQGIDFYNGGFVIFTGGSYSGDSSANKNIAALVRTSFSGCHLDDRLFLKSSFVANFGTTSGFESQSVNIFNNELYLMCYISGKLFILKEDVNGKYVGTTYKLNEVFYYGIADIGLTDAMLVSDPIATIVNTMLENSRLVQSVSDDTPRLQSVIGKQYGLLEIVKITNYRAMASFCFASSALTSPMVATSYVFGNTSTPFYYNRIGRLVSPVIYQSESIASVGLISIPGIETLSKLVLEVTHTAVSNAAIRAVYDFDDIRHIMDNSIPLINEVATSSITYRITSAGIQIIGVTGSPILRFITGS
jgi:hypothetical protein